MRGGRKGEVRGGRNGGAQEDEGWLRLKHTQGTLEKKVTFPVLIYRLLHSAARSEGCC